MRRFTQPIVESSPACPRPPIRRWLANGAAIAAILAVAACSAVASEYYVDADHPQASDTNPGTEDLPFETIQRAGSVAMAGDVVRVLPGAYAGPFRPARNGSAAAPITFLGIADGDMRPTIQGGSPGVDLHGRARVRIEGFEIANATGVGVLMDDGDHLEIVGCEIRDTAGNGVLIQRGADCVVRECHIHHVGGTNIKAGGLTYRVTRCIFTRNDLHDNGIEDGIQIGCGDDCEMSWNYVHDIWAPAPSHTDGIQLHSDNRNYRIIGNVVHRIRSEGFMIAAEGTVGEIDAAPHYEGNIMSDGGGVSFILSHNLRGGVLRHNTIMWGRYQSVWIHNSATGATVLGNVFQSPDGGCVVTSDSLAGLTLDYNLTTGTRGMVGPSGKRGDPMVVDPKYAGSPTPPNVRLRAGSPAIDAGPGGADMGALEYPNVYVVDVRHPAATDAYYGYPGLPLKTITRAIQLAQPGETIRIRAGIYRETVRPIHDGVALRAADGEQVVISGADCVTGWTRQVGQWSAPLAAEPRFVLQDGQLRDDFTYDAGAARLILSGPDPRLHPVEVIVRAEGVDLSAAPAAPVNGLEVVNTLNDFDPPRIRGRYVFYNRSAFDGDDPAATDDDDNAVATDKRALRSGQAAGFANYTTCARGLNGVMVDITDLPADLQASDFVLKTGTLADPAGWTDAPTPAQVAVRRGGGVGGSDRVTLTFDDGAIACRWLQVTVAAGPRTGLESPDVFYFGHTVGDTGNLPQLAAYVMVDEEDARRCISHPAGLNLDDFVVLKANFGAAVPVGERGDYDLDGNVGLDDFTILKQAFATTAGIENAFDINRDGRVNAQDAAIVKQNLTGTHAGVLLLITPP